MRTAPHRQEADGTPIEDIHIQYPLDSSLEYLRQAGNNAFLGIITPNKEAWESAVINVAAVEVAAARAKCKTLAEQIKKNNPQFWN